MKLNKIQSAILLSCLPAGTVLAAGLDRSGQSILPFLQPDNYFEASINALDPTVKGKDIAQKAVADMGEDYYFTTAALKFQANEHFSLGLLFDQPYGADSQYATDPSIFSTLNPVNQTLEGTSVKVRSDNLTALLGYQPNQNWNFYAGPVYQNVKANVSLRGAAYSSLSGYDINLKQDQSFGWVAGFAYQIPEIALKTAVTYRSEIKHNLDTTESFGFGAVAGMNNLTSSTEVITPEAVNIDFQTGIAANTLAFANLRWVPWSSFVVQPAALHQATALRGKAQNLIDYSDDQWSATVGVGRKFSEKWSASTAIGWDSGAGNPVTTLGPVEGYWSLGFGGQYSPAEDYFIAAGVKYFWLGDAKAQTGGTVVGEFEDNHAIAYGLKIGYKF